MKKILILCMAAMMTAAVMAADAYDVCVSAFGEYDMRGKTCYIASGNKDIPESDPEFKIYRDMIAQCLLINKAIPTYDEDAADIYLMLDYGITDKSSVAPIAIPHWGITGYSYSTINVNAGGFSSVTTVPQISYGINGVSTSIEEIPNFSRAVNLYAYDNHHREGKPIMLWKTNAYSDGTYNDLLHFFPYIATVMCSYMGVYTNGKKEHEISPNDGMALMIKNQHFLMDNVVPCPMYSTDKHGVGLEIASVSFFVGSTRIELLENLREGHRTAYFPKRTYLIHNGVRYPLSKVNLPYHPFVADRNYNFRGQLLPYHDDRLAIRLITLDFPVEVNAGDTIELVAYTNKKETKTRYHYTNIVLK